MTGKAPEPNDEDLRRAVGLIGKVAGSEVRRRPSGGLIAALVLAAAVVGIVGITLIMGDFSRNGDIEHPFVQSLSEAENIACSEFMAVGRVVSVAPSDETERIIVAFEVEVPIKPTAAQGTVELEILDPGRSDPQSALAAGDHVLLEVPARKDHSPAVYRGTRLEGRVAEIERYLDDAASTECPPYFQEGGSTVEMEDNPHDAG